MRRIPNPWRQAQEILREHRVRRVPVDVGKIANHYASVVEEALDPDVSGVLAPMGTSRWIILVNGAHPETRKRFSIAHELGHLVLHGYTTPHADRAFRFRDSHSSEGSITEEIQANQFAAELLMPRDQVLSEVGPHTLDHAPTDEAGDMELDQLAARLAERFVVSRQAMMIRISSLFA